MESKLKQMKQIGQVWESFLDSLVPEDTKDKAFSAELVQFKGYLDNMYLRTVHDLYVTAYKAKDNKVVQMPKKKVVDASEKK